MCIFKECIRFIVFTFNLICLVVGAALLTIGVIYQVNYTNFAKVIPDTYNLSLIPILTIVVGGIIFLISFLGCCGACKKSPCLLTTYAVILLVVFIFEIGVGVFAFVEIKDETEFKEVTLQSIDKIFTKTDNATLGLVDFIQKDLKCCGTYGPDFWEKEMHKDRPKSCYIDEQTQQFYKIGCKQKFYEFLKRSANTVGIVLLSLSVTEVIGAIVSLCLANSIRNEFRRGGYY